MTIWIIGIGVALGYFSVIHRTTSLGRSIFKTIPVVLFAVAAWQFDAPVLMVVGLGFSALGDWALSREGDRAFLVGLSSFALAHVCYIAVFAGKFSGFDLWPVMLAMAVLAISTEVWLAPFTGALRWPVRVYVGIITLMMVMALALNGELWLATLGAASFVVSDLILSVRLFRMKDGDAYASHASAVLWVFYIAGQAIIAYSGASF